MSAFVLIYECNKNPPIYQRSPSISWPVRCGRMFEMELYHCAVDCTKCIFALIAISMPAWILCYNLWDTRVKCFIGESIKMSSTINSKWSLCMHWNRVFFLHPSRSSWYTNNKTKTSSPTLWRTLFIDGLDSREVDNSHYMKLSLLWFVWRDTVSSIVTF